MSTFALGKSETCTVSVRRALDINDKHYFLRASPTDKFALGKSETCTVFVRRAPDINDKHYFLRASPTDKFADENSVKGLIERSNLVGENGR